jgi:hypothetical protein
MVGKGKRIKGCQPVMKGQNKRSEEWTRDHDRVRYVYVDGLLEHNSSLLHGLAELLETPNRHSGFVEGHIP